jgi:hypothetical protein
MRLSGASEDSLQRKGGQSEELKGTVAAFILFRTHRSLSRPSVILPIYILYRRFRRIERIFSLSSGRYGRANL